ncbi:camp-regulated phosphoprotein/endosulfine conserved region-domain-containing protein [Lactarius quietus]|nr:camp-regulated phosphoprotein/endosulfine conserved region-domain-containing protein [Lactarius quietus]
MIPARRNKVDISSLTEEEKKLFRLYGKLPTHKNVLTKMQKVPTWISSLFLRMCLSVVRLHQDRKYFDSGDYALSKAGVGPQNAVGTAIPNPENIPHASSHATHQLLSTSPANSATSPVRESSLAQNEMLFPDDREGHPSEPAAPAPVATSAQE